MSRAVRETSPPILSLLMLGALLVSGKMSSSSTVETKWLGAMRDRFEVAARFDGYSLHAQGLVTALQKVKMFKSNTQSSTMI